MRELLGAKILHEDFVKKTASINQLVLRIGAVFGIIVEALNMMRVLLLTNVKLGTLNNRIYFSFYLILFLCCAAFLVIDVKAHLSPKMRYGVYVVCGSIMLWWQLLFNLYDIYRAGAVGYFSIITGFFFFSGFLMFKPIYTIVNMCLCCGIFAVVLGLMFSSGEVINLLITVCLCMLMYLMRYARLGVEVGQAQQIREVQQELTDSQRDFQQTIEQYERIRDEAACVTFEWDIRADRARFSKEWRDFFDVPGDIPEFHQYISTQKQLSEIQKEMLLDCMEGIRQGVSHQKHEIILPTKTGEERWFEVCVMARTNEQDEPVFGIGMLSDVTMRREKLSQLEAKAQMDQFTGLLNKASVERHGEKLLGQLQRGEKLAAMILDLDNFKYVNDRFGHPAGDHVLKTIASMMRHMAPAGAVIGRIGGDEFIALLSARDLAAFETYAHELVRRIPQVQWHGMDLSVSCSVGLAVSGAAREAYSQLYRRADAALYQAKNRGKNQLYGDLAARV